jgi:hypothetical protein
MDAKTRKNAQKYKHPTLQRFAGRVKVSFQASTVNAKHREQAPRAAERHREIRRQPLS